MAKAGKYCFQRWHLSLITASLLESVTKDLNIVSPGPLNVKVKEPDEDGNCFDETALAASVDLIV